MKSVVERMKNISNHLVSYSFLGNEPGVLGSGCMPATGVGPLWVPGGLVWRAPSPACCSELQFHGVRETCAGAFLSLPGEAFMFALVHHTCIYSMLTI